MSPEQIQKEHEEYSRGAEQVITNKCEQGEGITRPPIDSKVSTNIAREEE